MYSPVHLCHVISAPLCTSLLDTKVTDTQSDIRGARYQNSTHAISHRRTNVQMVIIHWTPIILLFKHLMAFGPQ